MSELNPRKFNIGDVVYYIRNIGGRKVIDFGFVEDNYSDCVIVQKVEWDDTRLIDGIPFGDYPIASEWKRLPKDWTYDTELVSITTDEERANQIKERVDGIRFDVTEELKKLREEGILVNADTHDYAEIGTQVEGGMYRVVKQYSGYNPTRLSMDWYDLYDKYEDAKAVLDAEEAEMQRLINLSDYDWSVEQIDKTLDFWAATYGVEDNVKKKYRDFILSIPDTENVVVRAAGEYIEWKYDRNKRWNTIEL